jgi:DNA-binding CsgD family transcriptional regulator
VGAAGAAGVGVAGVAGVAGVGAAGTADAGDASTGVADAAKRSFSPYLGLFCLFYSIPLGYFKLSFFSGSEEGATWPLIMLTSLALIVLVTAIETLVRARNKPAFIFRVIVPVAIAGLLLLAILKGSDVVLPGILVYSAQLFLTIFCYNTFMSLAQGGERWAPAWFFAIGISFTDGGFVLGMLTSEVSSSLDSSQMLGLTLGVVYVVTLAGFLLLPRINETIVSHRKTQANGTAIAEEDTGLPMTSVRGSLYDVTLAFSESCQLTAREGEMLGCLLRGLSVPAIARETFLSKNTVRTHIAHIYQKAGVHSRDELIMRIEELEELG